MNSFKRGFEKYFPQASVTYFSLFEKSVSTFDYDLAIVNGEGAVSAKIHWGLYTPSMKCIERGIPVHFVNFSFDPRRKDFKSINEEFEEKWLHTFDLCANVSVRDPVSYQYLKNKGFDKVKLFPDLGCTYKSPNETQPTKTVLFGLGSIMKRIKFGPYKDKIKKLISDIKDLGYKVNLMNWPSNPVSDGRFLQEFATDDVHYKNLSFEEYWAQCNTSTLNITGRHHGTVMSFAAKCPFVTFDTNMWKTNGDNFFYGSLPFFNFDKLFDDINIEAILNNNYDSRLKLQQKYDKLAPYFWGHLEQIVKDKKSVVLEPYMTKTINDYLETII